MFQDMSEKTSPDFYLVIVTSRCLFFKTIFALIILSYSFVIIVTGSFIKSENSLQQNSFNHVNLGRVENMAVTKLSVRQCQHVFRRTVAMMALLLKNNVKPSLFHFSLSFWFESMPATTVLCEDGFHNHFIKFQFHVYI